jgi:hypothetical protein
MCSNCDGYASTDALPNVYGYAQDDTDVNPSANRNSHGDANSKPKRDPYGHTWYYSNSKPYAYSQPNAYCEAEYNTQDAAHPATAPVAFYEKEKHRSIRLV